MSRAVSVFRFLFRVSRAAAFRVLLGLALALWGCDALIWAATQRSVFVSVGLESWFWRGFWAPIQLFCAFFGVCLALIHFGLKPFAPRRSEEFLPLRGALSRFEGLRAAIYPLARALAVLWALWLAREFSRHSLEWIFLRFGGRDSFDYLGLDAALWTRFLPLWMPFLLGMWRFALPLGFLIAATGVLRNLPLIAAQNRVPEALSRILWRTGALILALRAVLYAYQTLDLPRGHSLSSGDLFILAPLWIFGALWCGVLSLRFAARAIFAGRERLPKHRTRSEKRRHERAPVKATRAALTFFGALWLPSLLGVLSWPLRAVTPETAALKFERQRATRAAWHLPESENAGARPIATGALTANQSATLPESENAALLKRAALEGASGNNAAQNAVSLLRAWPVWDEAALLSSTARTAFRGGRLVRQQSATLDFQNGAWSALLAGQNAGDEAWNSSRAIGKSSALSLEQLELSSGRSRALPNTEAFFGLEGHALFGESGGISLESPFLKWAWAWRERDFLLPVDAAVAPHLLTLRGARERAQVLAPFLTPIAAPRLILESGKPVWRLDLCALSPNFPGAMRGVNGVWTGANSASRVWQMRLDARSGGVAFFAPPRETEASSAGESSSGAGEFGSDTWRAAFPNIARQNEAFTAASGGDLGRAQMEIAASLRGQNAEILGPTRALNSGGQNAWQVLAIGNKSFELLEGAAPRPILARGNGDLGARLDAIAAAIAKTRAASELGVAAIAASDSTPNAASLSANGANSDGKNGLLSSNGVAPVSGSPFVWRDARAPGGFWVARAFFAAPVIAASNETAHTPILWRVALTGSAANAPVGVGNSARSALVEFRLQSAAPRARVLTPLNSQANGKSARPKSFSNGAANTPLEVAALRTHRAMQEAARRSDWETFGALSERQSAILERLVAESRAVNAPKSTSKSASE